MNVIKQHRSIHPFCGHGFVVFLYRTDLDKYTKSEMTASTQTDKFQTHIIRIQLQ
jgi:hypothetical protein